MLNHTGTVELTTERLTLRRFTAEDAQAMFDNWGNDSDVTEFLTWVPHGNIENTRAILEMWVGKYTEPTYYNWAIVFEGEAVGGIEAFGSNERSERVAVGYCLSKKCWGKGIMPEAFGAVIDHLFGTVGFNSIEAEHDVFNPKSGRVMQKCGMTLDGVRRAAWRHRSGEFHDLANYSILRDEWRKAWLDRCKG